MGPEAGGGAGAGAAPIVAIAASAAANLHAIARPPEPEPRCCRATGAIQPPAGPFDIGQLKMDNLEDLVDQLNDLTVDAEQEKTKVRIYCE
jgi:hypothetical protein